MVVVLSSDVTGSMVDSVPEVVLVAISGLVSSVTVVCVVGVEQFGALVPSLHVTRVFTLRMAICRVDRELMRLNVPSAGISLLNTNTESMSTSELLTIAVILPNS